MRESQELIYESEFVTTGQAAAILGVRPDTVRLWCRLWAETKKEGLRAVKHGRDWQIKREDVENLKAQRAWEDLNEYPER